MSPELLANALVLAGNLGYLFIATADSRGAPHLAIAERIDLAGENTVSVTAWFCPQTTETSMTIQILPW